MWRVAPETQRGRMGQMRHRAGLEVSFCNGSRYRLGPVPEAQRRIAGAPLLQLAVSVRRGVADGGIVPAEQPGNGGPVLAGGAPADWLAARADCQCEAVSITTKWAVAAPFASGR